MRRQGAARCDLDFQGLVHIEAASRQEPVARKRPVRSGSTEQAPSCGEPVYVKEVICRRHCLATLSVAIEHGYQKHRRERDESQGFGSFGASRVRRRPSSTPVRRLPVVPEKDIAPWAILAVSVFGDA